MRIKSQPSEQFIGAIVRAYDKEKRTGKRVTPSALWDHIVIECFHTPNGFEAMFAWDTRKSPGNRIRTIMETIEAGLVPNLLLTNDAKGRPVVDDIPF